MNPSRLLLVPVLISMLSACGGTSDTTAIKPVVSMNASISDSELTSGYAPYTTEYNAIYADGARGAQTAAPWSSLEPPTRLLTI